MAVQTQWQSTSVARMPPLSTCVGPAMKAASGRCTHTDVSPSKWLWMCRPSGFSVPQPQQ